MRVFAIIRGDWLGWALSEDNEVFIIDECPKNLNEAKKMFKDIIDVKNKVKLNIGIDGVEEVISELNENCFYAEDSNTEAILIEVKIT